MGKNKLKSQIYWTNSKGKLSGKVEALTDKELMEELLFYLDKTEVSDNDREFKPNYISSCRVMDGDILRKVLKEMKERVLNG